MTQWAAVTTMSRVGLSTTAPLQKWWFGRPAEEPKMAPTRAAPRNAVESGAPATATCVWGAAINRASSAPAVANERGVTYCIFYDERRTCHRYGQAGDGTSVLLVGQTVQHP